MVRKPRHLSESIVNTGHPRLDVVPADFSLRYLDLELANLDKPTAQITRILERVEERFDSVFLDCPPGYNTDYRYRTPRHRHCLGADHPGSAALCGASTNSRPT